ncbi:MAG: tetratricopeptide repeat protein [bacterium]|nr:tetratricopeptide repeat protein [bacterium]
MQYRPLLPLTLSLNYALHRYWLPGYHLFSISVHACSAVFCFLFFVHLLRRWEERVQLTRTAVAWWAAALYVVHPIAGFPVNYLVARDLLMMQMFLLAGLYVYVRLRLDGGAGWRWPLCLCLLLLALCAKTNAVTAPGMVFLLEFVVLGERLTAWRAWVRVAVWTVAVAGFLLWVRFGVGFSDAEQLLGGDCLSYLLTQFRVHVFNYLRNVIWPFEIRALPYVPAARSLLEWRVALGAAVIFGSLGTALALVRRAPFYSFCIFAYWGMAALESSVFPLHINVTDYRTYPSLPYLCLLIVLLVAKFPWRRVVYASLAVLTIYFGASAFYMNRHFRTGETFWRQSVRYGTHALGTMNYGMSLRGKNDREALRYLQRAVELNPNYYLGRINLGLCYISLGRHAEGIAEARAGAACASELCKDLAYFWLSQAYKAIGDVTQAYEAVRVALAHNQHNVEYLYEGSYLAQLCGDHATASAWLSNLHTRVENYQISRFMAGWSYQARGMNEAALAEYERAIAAAPDYPQVYANKGYALYALGRYAEAARAFEEHLRRVPGHPGSLISLSNCITRLKAKGD